MTKDELKAFFLSGLEPEQNNYHALIDFLSSGDTATEELEDNTVTVSTVKTNITLSGGDSELTTVDITGDDFDFKLYNLTGDDLEITEGATIDLFNLGTVWAKNGSVIGFHIVGGKAQIVNIDNYYFAEFATFHGWMTAGRLKPCSKICITDFASKYDQPDYEDDGGIVPKSTIVTKTATVEPLVVLATSGSTIAPQAWSLTYPKDYIEYDPTIITTYVNETACKGKITFRRDDKGNEVNGDLRGIRLKRYDRGGDENYVWYYDSGSDGFDDDIPIFGADCYNNVFEKMSNDLWVELVAFFDVENFVFGDANLNNKFGVYNINNSWGNSNSGNSWGNSNSGNSWGNSNSGNSWGDYNDSNYLGDYNDRNTWGDGNYSNTWGDSNTKNTWGNNNNSNTFVNAAISNTFLYPVNSTDFTSATHIYADYNCEIYKDATDGLKLRYMDEGAWVIADITD